LGFLWDEYKIASQHIGNNNKSQTFMYTFNENWKNKYFFINVNNKCMCLMCNASVAVGKKCNVKWHSMTMHKDYISKYSNSEIHRNKVEDLKCNLWLCQAIFSKPINKAKALPLLHIKSQKYWWRSPLKIVMLIKNVLLWQVIRYLMNSKIKLKYALQLRRSSYFKVLSLEEWNVCMMTMNKWGKILKLWIY